MTTEDYESLELGNAIAKDFADEVRTDDNDATAPIGLAMPLEPEGIENLVNETPPEDINYDPPMAPTLSHEAIEYVDDLSPEARKDINDLLDYIVQNDPDSEENQGAAALPQLRLVEPPPPVEGFNEADYSQVHDDALIETMQEKTPALKPAPEKKEKKPPSEKPKPNGGKGPANGRPPAQKNRPIKNYTLYEKVRYRVTKPWFITKRFMSNLVEAVDGVNYAVSQLPEYITQLENTIKDVLEFMSAKHVYRFIELPGSDGSIVINTEQIHHIASMGDTIEINLTGGQVIRLPMDEYEPLMESILGTPMQG